MIRTINERLQAEETKWGKFIKNWIGKVLILCSIMGAATEYLNLIPGDYVPQWLKTTVAVSGVIAFIGGKLTVKNDTKVEMRTTPEETKVIVTKDGSTT